MKAMRFPFIISNYVDSQRDVILEAVKETFNGPKQAQMFSGGRAIGFYTSGQSLDRFLILSGKIGAEFDLSLIGYEESDLLLTEDGDPFPATTLVEIVGYTAHVKDGDFVNGTEKVCFSNFEKEVQNYILEVLD